MSTWPNYISLKGAQTIQKRGSSVSFPFSVWTIIYAALAHGDPQHQPEQEFAQIPQRTVLIEGRRWQASVVPAYDSKGQEVLAVLVAAVPVANSGKKEQRWVIPVEKLRNLKFNYSGVMLVPPATADPEEVADETPDTPADPSPEE